MKKRLILAVSLVIQAVSVAHVEAAEPLNFQKVMKELGRNMQVITDGISREDWDLVAKTAPMIAEHPQPPLAEKMRIMSFMGANMPKFKELDGATHEAAHHLLHAAQEKDGKKVIVAFEKVQSACLSCHQTFRGKFVEHFYGTSSNSINVREQSLAE